MRGRNEKTKARRKKCEPCVLGNTGDQWKAPGGRDSPPGRGIEAASNLQLQICTPVVCK